jgi:transcriptional regulator with XRE-family HTH domain
MHAAGLTQGALAKAVGMSQSSIWKLTSGAASGSRRTVEIAKVLGVRPDWLASGVAKEKSMIQKNEALITKRYLMTPIA